MRVLSNDKFVKVNFKKATRYNRNVPEQMCSGIDSYESYQQTLSRQLSIS